MSIRNLTALKTLAQLPWKIICNFAQLFVQVDKLFICEDFCSIPDGAVLNKYSTMHKPHKLCMLSTKFSYFHKQFYVCIIVLIFTASLIPGGVILFIALKNEVFWMHKDTKSSGPKCDVYIYFDFWLRVSFG